MDEFDERDYSDNSGDDEDGNDSPSEASVEENDESQHEEESEKLRKELADVPLGELQKLKETVGLKKYNEALFGTWKPQSHTSSDSKDKLSENDQEPDQVHSDIQKIETKKKTKSEPEERSSKVKSYWPRKVVENNRRKKRDPRFDDMSGTLNEDLFKKSYTFVDEIKKKEVNAIRKQLKKVKGKEKKDNLTKLLQRIEQKDKLDLATEKRKENQQKRKKEELNSVQQGKKAFYLKNSDKKKIELAEKYRELKKTGQLDKYLGKKFKRNASKQKKNLPNLTNR